ncbi:MAG: metal ABC transporter permease [Bacteroidetes bacterium]|nr:metal ABC transporter permease [Bacteroidota bacterium]
MILELFQYKFFISATLAALLTSISCGIIGTYIVSKRIVFISGGITHASFGGIGLGYFFGFNPILGAVGFSILSALGIEFMAKKTDVREDSAIAIMWSFGMAMGIIFIFLTPGYAPNLLNYLFGNILTVSTLDLYLSVLLSAALAIFFLLYYKPIIYISFDEEFSRTRKISVSVLNYILISFVALTIVLSIKVAGIILVISLLTIPQASVNLFSKDFKKIILYSVLLGFLGSFGGLIFSYYLNIPSGAAIIFLLVLIFIIFRLIKYILSGTSSFKSSIEG